MEDASIANLWKISSKKFMAIIIKMMRLMIVAHFHNVRHQCVVPSLPSTSVGRPFASYHFVIKLNLADEDDEEASAADGAKMESFSDHV